MAQVRPRPGPTPAGTAGPPGDLGAAEAGEHYADLYDFVPVALLTIDRAGILREINLAALQLLGAQRSALLGIPLFNLVLTDDRPLVRRHILRIRQQTRTDARAQASIEITLAPRDGALLPVRLLSQRAAGLREAYWTVLIDLSERARGASQAQALRDSERLARKTSEAKDLFISVLGHELRSPLAAVASAAAALATGDLSRAELGQLASLLQRTAAAQGRLIDDLLDLTAMMREKVRIERAAVDVHEVALDALQTFSREISAQALSLTVDLTAARSVVDGDGVRLKQIFWNLIGNAIKFTPKAGKLGVRSWNNDARILIEVSDSGAGIEAGQLERLFEPFEQASPDSAGKSGVGLGLAIAKGLVDLHGGHNVAASPGPGKGARFVVELPVLVAPPLARGARRLLPAPGPAAPAGRGTAQRRIVLVEDNADIAKPLARALEQAGYHVAIASTLEAALREDYDDVDVLLSDLDLPDGNGLSLVRRILQKTDVAAIALSGHAAPPDLDASRQAGFVAHVKKPFDFPTLLAAIESAMKSPRLHRPGR